MDDETLEVASDDECPLNDYVCLCFRMMRGESVSMQDFPRKRALELPLKCSGFQTRWYCFNYFNQLIGDLKPHSNRFRVVIN